MDSKKSSKMDLIADGLAGFLKVIFLGIGTWGQTERFLGHIPGHRVMRRSGNVPSVPLLVPCLSKRPARVSALANRAQVSVALDFRSIIGPRLQCPSVAESVHGQP